MSLADFLKPIIPPSRFAKHQDPKLLIESIAYCFFSEHKRHGGTTYDVGK